MIDLEKSRGRKTNGHASQHCSVPFYIVVLAFSYSAAMTIRSTKKIHVIRYEFLGLTNLHVFLQTGQWMNIISHAPSNHQRNT